METSERIQSALYKAVDDVNLQLMNEQQVEKNSETILIGPQAKIDSLALVNLIVAAEENINQEFNASLTLVNENALVEDESPFKTLGSFMAYIAQLLKEQGIAS